MIKSLFLVLFAGVFLLSAANVLAVEVPEYPVCSNPQGTLKVSYESGSHAIVGEEGLREGKDEVYSLDGERLLQCLCEENGDGTQTNWWKVSSLTQEEIEILVKLGWQYVPSGANWGLESAPYLAMNSEYACGGGDEEEEEEEETPLTQAGATACTAERPDAPFLISVQRNGSEATLNWTKVEKATHYMISYGKAVGSYDYGVANTGNVTSYTVGGLNPNDDYYFIVYAVNDCMPSEPSSERPIGGGMVLGWASTGNMGEIAGLLVAGAALAGGGVWLRKRSS